MKLAGIVTAVVFVLSLAVRASAEPPHQADVDACNKEAAATRPVPTASTDDTNSRATDSAEMTVKAEKGVGAVNGRKEASTSAERQAFAGCLARHGYYKGYYH